MPPGGQPAPAAGRDTDAVLRTLYAEHWTALLYHVTGILFDVHQAEEVVQETMLRAWRHVDELYPERVSVRSWLKKVAYNIAIDRIRAKQVRPHEVAQSPVSDDAALADHSNQVVNSIDLARALAELSAVRRRVLYEVYYAGRTCSEAAAVLGVPVGTVKSRLYHALKELRRSVEQEAGTERDRRRNVDRPQTAGEPLAVGRRSPH